MVRSIKPLTDREYSIGTYPTISLSKARSIRAELKSQIPQTTN